MGKIITIAAFLSALGIIVYLIFRARADRKPKNPQPSGRQPVATPRVLSTLTNELFESMVQIFVNFAARSDAPPAVILKIRQPTGRMSHILVFLMPNIGREQIDERTLNYLRQCVDITGIRYRDRQHQEAGKAQFHLHAAEMKAWEEGCAARKGTNYLPVMSTEMALKNAFFAALYEDRDDIVNEVRRAVGMMPRKQTAQRHNTALVLQAIGQSSAPAPSRPFMSRSETVEGIPLAEIDAAIKAARERTDAITAN